MSSSIGASTPDTKVRTHTWYADLADRHHFAEQLWKVFGSFKVSRWLMNLRLGYWEPLVEPSPGTRHSHHIELRAAIFAFSQWYQSLYSRELMKISQLAIPGIFGSYMLRIAGYKTLPCQYSWPRERLVLMNYLPRT